MNYHPKYPPPLYRYPTLNGQGTMHRTRSDDCRYASPLPKGDSKTFSSIDAVGVAGYKGHCYADISAPLQAMQQYLSYSETDNVLVCCPDTRGTGLGTNNVTYPIMSLRELTVSR